MYHSRTGHHPMIHSRPGRPKAGQGLVMMMMMMMMVVVDQCSAPMVVEMSVYDLSGCQVRTPGRNRAGYVVFLAYQVLAYKVVGMRKSQTKQSNFLIS